MDSPARSDKRLGSKYLKPLLKRTVRAYHGDLEGALKKLLEDAAGKTQVEHAATYEGGVSKYRLEIDPADRHRALGMIRDSLDGKPLQEVAVEAGALTNVVIVRAQLGQAPELPESVKAILASKDQEAEDPYLLEDAENW